MSQEKNQREAKRWLKQAGSDLQAARDSSRTSHYEWACFQAQQAAEKAMKSLWYHMSYEPWGHSLVKLVEDIPDSLLRDELTDIEEHAKSLDKLYIPTRYPNGLPDLTPSDVYTKSEADTAIESAQKILDEVSKLAG